MTAPSVPSSLAVSGTTATSISLSWGASPDTGGSGRAGYRIYRNGSVTPLASVTGRTFTDSGLVTGTSNTYRVTAYDNAGNESGPAGPVTGTTRDATAPSVPQGLQSSNVTANSLTLTWSASIDTGGSGLAGYRVFRSGTLVATVTTTSFTNTGLTANTTYRYRVAAVDNAGNQSSQSGQLSVTTLR
jgi:chitodextrinase